MKRRRLLDIITGMPAAAAQALIWIYQHTVSPALSVAAPSCGCRFHPTCSGYASEAIRTHGLLRGSALAVRRLARCAPWSEPGLDPVPPLQTRSEPVQPRKRVCTAVQRHA